MKFLGIFLAYLLAYGLEIIFLIFGTRNLIFAYKNFDQLGQNSIPWILMQCGIIFYSLFSIVRKFFFKKPIIYKVSNQQFEGLKNIISQKNPENKPVISQDSNISNQVTQKIGENIPVSNSSIENYKPVESSLKSSLK